jgi:hypothetical protein
LSVELASGRKFTGLVDGPTSDKSLALRFVRDGAVLRRTIEWESIAAASIDGEPLDAATLKETAMRLRSDLPGRSGRAQPGPSAVESAPHASRAAGSTSHSATSDLPVSRVTAVSFDARVGNWDSDVETDGLVIDVFPLGESGEVVPAGGIVEVELFAPQKRVFDQAPLSSGDTLERVERWTRAIRPSDVERGARFKLAFGAVHPEFDLDWIGVGLVHVRLVVPGDGVFEDSSDGLRIRPYAPLRDRLEMSTGRRFLPTERLGRGN